jgi:pseudouridine 5'-phosphatase
MNSIPRPAALIFDLDGTLLDTEPLYTMAAQKVMDPYGATYTLALKQKSMGGDSRRSAQLAIDHGQLPLSVDEYLHQREGYLIRLFADAPEMPDAGAFIDALAQTDLRFGLATSSHQHLCELKLSNKTWGKPAPDIFLLCAQALGVEPGQCLAFEDSPNGIAAALAAGMSVIAVNSPYVERSQLTDAILVIDRYEELMPLLRDWQTA